MEEEILRVFKKMQLLDILVNNILVVAIDNPKSWLFILKKKKKHILNFILTNRIWPAQNYQ